MMIYSLLVLAIGLACLTFVKIKSINITEDNRLTYGKKLVFIQYTAYVLFVISFILSTQA